MKPIITVIGPSGSGKTSIVKGAQIFYNYIMRNLPIPNNVNPVLKNALKFVQEKYNSGLLKVDIVNNCICGEAISHTTRTIRKDEIEDVTYHYIDDDTFNKIDKIEETVYDGAKYCLSKTAINEVHADIVLAIVDQEGALSIIKNAPTTISVFLIMNPNQMRPRLELRGDNESKIVSRIKHAENNNEYYFDKADVVIDSTRSLGYVLFDFIKTIESVRKTLI